jgi:DNA-binding NtrC family response regulator
MATILVVDDDPQLRQSFERLLKAEGHTVLTAPSGEKGVEIASESEPDMAVLDVRLPGMNGLETFKVLRGMYPSLPVLVMTAYGTTETAIEATKMGAFDYVMKPFNVPNVLSLIGRAVEVRAPRPVSNDSVATSDALLGRSVAMQEVCKQIGRAAPTQATVLIRGESGTGKELVAHAIHKHSNRSDHPFCVINCVAIPETLLESELFGYEKGAFTGASNRKAGKIEQANRGTVFLDEIGDMPPPIQAKILRLLQERQIERLGGKLPIPVDVRIIAATNRDLEKAVASGEFREDLYYRLNVVSLTLPPLRERREDISLLGAHFLEKFAKELNMPNPGLTDRAKAALQRARAWQHDAEGPYLQPRPGHRCRRYSRPARRCRFNVRRAGRKHGRIRGALGAPCTACGTRRRAFRIAGRQVLRHSHTRGTHAYRRQPDKGIQAAGHVTPHAHSTH